MRQIGRRALDLRMVQWRLLAEASVYLGKAAWLLAFAPFKRLADPLGPVTPAVMDDFAEPSQTYPANPSIKDIGWSIRTAAGYVPWPSLCLCQALAGAWMLRRRRLGYRLILGTRRDEAEKMTAHAWLISGQVLTGGHETPTDYRLVATFWSDLPRQGTIGATSVDTDNPNDNRHAGKD